MPALRALGPEICDAALLAFGRAVSATSPEPKAADRRGRLANERILGAGWDEPRTASAVAGNVARFSARDYPLDGLAERRGALPVSTSRGSSTSTPRWPEGRGVVLVGSHLGAHVPRITGSIDEGVPLRAAGPAAEARLEGLARAIRPRRGHPQSEFFLRRKMTPAESVDRLLRARSALRDGLAVYLSGDILWPGPNCRKGRLLGVDRTFLAVWADLAAHARAPVVFLFARHRPGGRYALTFGAPRTIEPGAEDLAVDRYLRRLEAEIVANPADAVAYLLWPCFGPPPRRSPTPARGSAGGSRWRSVAGSLPADGTTKEAPATGRRGLQGYQ